MRLARVAVLSAAFFAAIQLVPYGRDHQNPPIVAEPVWKGEGTRETFYRVCKDCHSNETVWPWYASIAPVSWLVQSDVDEGRSHFNVSRWGEGKQDADEAAGMVRKDEMPPWFYLPLHPEAKLDEAEKQAFLRGLIETFGDEQEEGGHHEG